MTEQHPLTDEICRHLADTEDRLFTAIEMDNMRVAADWQLEQVIKFMKERERMFGGDGMIFILEDAMRPLTQEDN
jgi:hypothetical protein